MTVKRDIIENKAFWADRALREVTVPAGIRHIGDWAFAKCVNLERERLRTIFGPAFSDGTCSKAVTGLPRSRLPIPMR